jgi:hypothetical protein
MDKMEEQKMTQTKTTTLVDTTPAGIYELCDAKRLLAALNQLVQHFFEDGDDRLEPLFGVIDAIRDKIDAAEKMLEAPLPER